MNKFVCIAVVVTMFGTLVAGGPGFQKDIEENLAACKVEEGATDDDIAIFKRQEVPTSQTGKCFVACVFEKIGFISGGAFSREMADSKVKNSPMSTNHPEMMAKILQGNADCEKEIGTGTERCETGPKVMACFNKMHKGMGPGMKMQ